VLGEKDQAFRWLNLGKKQQCDCLVWLQAEPWMDPLRIDPRYFELVKRVFGRTPAPLFISIDGPHPRYPFLSTANNQSEVGHAFNARKRLLPVRLVSSNLPPDFDYFLSTRQWLDASEGFTDETLKRLLEAVSGSLAEDQEADLAAQRARKES